MQNELPRFMIAGSGSGCGKTTVTCAILKALSNRGMHIGAFKCGPDYIDPMFHSRILHDRSTNLDSFFFDENTLRALLVKNAAGKDLSIIEGVMGFYDGLGLTSGKASSCEIAQITRTPVILVLNAKGTALSLLAVIQGFLNFTPENMICGVILNRCNEMTYTALAAEIRKRFGDSVRPYGYLPPMSDCSLESRHLGLVTTEEVVDLDEKTEKLAVQAEKSIDLDGLIRTAQRTEPIQSEPIEIMHFQKKIRIGAAQDKAFCFYYHDNLDLLREMGAEIIPFSPLSSHKLPENIHGLYLGGGYPELYAESLSLNTSMRADVREGLMNGMPCIAECGGFMYLTESIDGYPMVGVLPGNCYNTGKLTRFGYVKLKAKQDNMLCDKGTEIAAHEFHYWDCDEPGADFTAEKVSGKKWDCIHAEETLYAGFPHFHFYANPEFAIRFYKACLKYKEKAHAGNRRTDGH